MPDDKTTPSRDTMSRMGVTPLGTLPEAEGSKIHDHYFNVADGERGGGQHRVWYNEKSGIAFCASDNSKSCRHAVRVAELFGINNTPE
jgi:hypothetical protein